MGEKQIRIWVISGVSRAVSGIFKQKPTEPTIKEK